MGSIASILVNFHLHGIDPLSNCVPCGRHKLEDELHRTGVRVQTRRLPAAYSRLCPRLWVVRLALLRARAKGPASRRTAMARLLPVASFLGSLCAAAAAQRLLFLLVSMAPECFDTNAESGGGTPPGSAASALARQSSKINSAYWRILGW
jgi:hypothetical protein